METPNVDGDEDDEYEEMTVMVELSGIVDTDYFSKCDASNCRIWGASTSQPILQLDRYFFVGDYHDVVGTCLFFEPGPEEKQDDDDDAQDSASPSFLLPFSASAYRESATVFNQATSHTQGQTQPNAPNLRLCGHTFKKLAMQRAFLNKKMAAADGPSQEEDEEESPDGSGYGSCEAESDADSDAAQGNRKRRPNLGQVRPIVPTPPHAQVRPIVKVETNSEDSLDDTMETRGGDTRETSGDAMAYDSGAPGDAMACDVVDIKNISMMTLSE